MQDIRNLRRIKVDGIHYSDVHFQVAATVFKTGQMGMCIDGIEPTLQNLALVRQVLDAMVKQIDAKLPEILRQETNKLVMS